MDIVTGVGGVVNVGCVGCYVGNPHILFYFFFTFFFLRIRYGTYLHSHQHTNIANMTNICYSNYTGGIRTVPIWNSPAFIQTVGTKKEPTPRGAGSVLT